MVVTEILLQNEKRLGLVLQMQSVCGGYSRSYTHNFDGSTVSDGTLNIQYNALNLPKQVTGTPAGTVSYIYSADGSKLT